MIYTGDSRWGSSSACRRACCWTPFGHSGVRDASSDDPSFMCWCHEHLVPESGHLSRFVMTPAEAAAESSYS